MTRAGRGSQPPTPIAIVGCVGLPPRYGGFETLAANLVAYRDAHSLPIALTVYCSAKAYPERATWFGGARLRYLPFNANGASSIAYDIVSLLDAVRRGDRAILVLGVSGAIILPLIRLISRARLIVNVDGLEWKRAKWSRAAAWFLRLSEAIAVRSAHVVVADNAAIADHIGEAYGRPAVEIAYGGDHAVALLDTRDAAPRLDRPDASGMLPYGLMLCRIEPENNVHMILEAFARMEGLDLLAVGNWQASDYGRTLYRQYHGHPGIRLRDPVFDPVELTALRAAAAFYVHGLSAGGTNPALVEMMHFATPVIAYSCVYNRRTTEEAALYFDSSDDLVEILSALRPDALMRQGQQMRAIALRRYTWEVVGRDYFDAMAPPRGGPSNV